MTAISIVDFVWMRLTPSVCASGIGNITAAVEKNGLADSITMMFTTVPTHRPTHVTMMSS